MRFHIGLSLNWKTIKKWILPILIGILLFLGLSSSMQVHAESTVISPTWMITYLRNSENGVVLNQSCPPYSSDFCTISSSTVKYGVYASAAYPYKTTLTAGNTYKFTILSTLEPPNALASSYKMHFGLQDGTYTSFYNVTDISITQQNNAYKYVYTFKPTTTLNISSFYVKIYYTDTGVDTSMYIGFYRQFWFEEIKDTDQAIINRQDQMIDEQEKTNEKLDNLEDSITSPDVDSDTGNDFFNNFSTEDNGGISGIITAPLTLINSLLDGQGTCTDLKFPIFGKEVALPSGCIIWDKVPNEMEVLIQTLVCGTGAYFLLRQLFKDIEKLKNPNNTEVSTLDL